MPLLPLRVWRQACGRGKGEIMPWRKLQFASPAWSNVKHAANRNAWAQNVRLAREQFQAHSFGDNDPLKHVWNIRQESLLYGLFLKMILGFLKVPLVRCLALPPLIAVYLGKKSVNLWNTKRISHCFDHSYDCNKMTSWRPSELEFFGRQSFIHGSVGFLGSQSETG